MSLGSIVARPIPLAREVRADRDGIRTFLAVGSERVKFEILYESRIDLSGVVDKRLQVPVLSHDSVVAEKFLAMTDRGTDRSTFARDLIDLAFLASKFGAQGLVRGKKRADSVYGRAVQEAFSACLTQLGRDRSFRAECLRALGIDDEKALVRGLSLLRTKFVTAGSAKAKSKKVSGR